MYFGPPVPFLTERPEDFASPYRVVLLFDSHPGYSAHKLCGADLESVEPTANDVVRLHAALCANENPLTTLSGRVSGAFQSFLTN